MQRPGDTHSGVRSTDPFDLWSVSDKKVEMGAMGFDQSTLLPSNNASYSDLKRNLRGQQRKVRAQPMSVTFVADSFLSNKNYVSRKPDCKKENIRNKKEKPKNTKNKKKSKYNFVKKIFNESKKKFKNAKKFFRKIGSKKPKPSEPKAESNPPPKV